MRPSSFLSFAAAGALIAATWSGAVAAQLALDIAGEFGPRTTLGGTPLGTNTPFSFHAVFDASDDVNPTPGAGYFRPTEFTIEIAGHGTFAGVPNVDLNIVVLDPSYHLGVYGAGLVTSKGTPFYLHTYAAVAPPFNPPTPTPTTFQDFLRTLDSFSLTPYVIPLADGAGSLAIRDFGSAAPTAALVTVPEPIASCMVTCCAMVTLAARMRHRRIRQVE